MEGTVTGETVIEGPLVERSANEKTVLEGTVNKNGKLKNLSLNDQDLRTCGKVHVQMVRCFPLPVV